MASPNVVAACQFDPKRGDITGNLHHASQLAFEAAAKGARIIVLPELCISGHAFKSVAEAASAAQTRDGYQTQEFLPIAHQHNCHIVFGYVEIDEGLLYNSALVVGPNGVVANSRKHNLYGRDFLWATPGETLHPIVPTSEGRLGILICRDAMNQYRTTHPFFRGGQPFYRKGSVDIVALPTNWHKPSGYPPVEWMELAEGSGANVVVANRIGRDVEMEFTGGSCIISRDLHVWTNGSSFIDEAVVGGIVI